MDVQFINFQLEKEWEQPDGFLGGLRLGNFDPAGLERLIQILQSVEVKDTTIFNRRFVSLTWYIPLFMTWQQERVQEQGGNVKELKIATNKIQELLEKILGVP